MEESIPRSPMSEPERYGSALGLAAAGLAIGGAAALAPEGLWVVLLIAAAVGLGLALIPGQRLRYRIEPAGVRVGRLLVPFEQITDARLVRLRHTILLWGLSLPGYWWGAAWSPGLGWFRIRGSTGLGPALMLRTRDGLRYVITPADPLALVVKLQALIGQPGRKA